MEPMLTLNLGDLEYLILVLVPHKCYDYKFEQLYLVCGARDRALDLLHAREAFCPLRYTPIH